MASVKPDNRIVVVYDELPDYQVRFNGIVYKNLAAFQKLVPKKRYQLVPNRREKRSKPR